MTETMNAQQERQPTAEENFRTLFARVANLSDRVSELEATNQPIKALQHAARALRRVQPPTLETVTDINNDAVIRDALRAIDRVLDANGVKPVLL